MRQEIRKMFSLKVKCYNAIMIDIKEYLAVFHGAKTSENCFDTELREILLKSTPDSWRRQAYVHGFDCEYITLKICRHV